MEVVFPACILTALMYFCVTYAFFLFRVSLKGDIQKVNLLKIDCHSFFYMKVDFESESVRK